MAKKRKKGAVRPGKGVMCNICGLNCGKGGALKKHVEGTHDVDYDAYKICFYGEAKTVIADAWDDSVATTKGKTVVTHVLVRRFIGDPGPRGATRSARKATK
ncbi:MAG: hypothetical protein IID30_11875 [Planctomycetes bacterium]|nr:hypothetical protein [Planctomycetota bacterium]